MDKWNWQQIIAEFQTIIYLVSSFEEGKINDKMKTDKKRLVF